jgi:hypothetical protein
MQDTTEAREQRKAIAREYFAKIQLQAEEWQKARTTLDVIHPYKAGALQALVEQIVVQCPEAVEVIKMLL